jgi:hypothetical protein
VIIDEPSPFSPLKEWKLFIEELATLSAETPEDQLDIERAQSRALAHIEAISE